MSSLSPPPSNVILEDEKLLNAVGGGATTSYQSATTVATDDEESNLLPQVARGRKIRRVAYSAKNHVQVLFQMYGSALPQVLPFCVVNVLWTLTAYFLNKYKICNLEFNSGTGHSFMGLLVSFLVVSRSTISYNRFMTIRKHLSETYRSCRELVQFACVYTFRTNSVKAKQWRQDVAFRTILLLRVTMDTLKWSSENMEQWDQSYEATSESTRRMSATLNHGTRTLADEAFRAPTMFSHILRETIMNHPDYLEYTMPVNEYRDLVIWVSKFNEAFHGFRVLIFTPYPFPLVQMTRIFLFFWVYSLPLVLVKQLDSIVDTCIIIFLITFGFVGTEYVSMMLDDPFSSDVSNIDETGIAELVFEDIYLALWRTDGRQSATRLKERVMERYRLGRGQDCFRHDMNDMSFWRKDSEEEEGDNNNDDDDENKAPPEEVV